MPYVPPLTITSRLIDLISRISEALGRWEAAAGRMSPRLRRENRIRSIHSSLAIENNTLSLDQVTAIIDGKQVRGQPREIKEVQNAFVTYELLDSLKPATVADFLKAHGTLMQGLVSGAGAFRRGGVGVYQGTKLVHMAPPANRVPYLVKDLFQWLKKTDLHPLLAAAVVHYEIEFIHPFADGNGRMGRLCRRSFSPLGSPNWPSCRWKPWCMTGKPDTTAPWPLRTRMPTRRPSRNSSWNRCLRRCWHPPPMTQ